MKLLEEFYPLHLSVFLLHPSTSSLTGNISADWQKLKQSWVSLNTCRPGKIIDHVSGTVEYLQWSMDRVFGAEHWGGLHQILTWLNPKTLDLWSSHFYGPHSGHSFPM